MSLLRERMKHLQEITSLPESESDECKGHSKRVRLSWGRGLLTVIKYRTSLAPRHQYIGALVTNASRALTVALAAAGERHKSLT